MDHRSTLDTDVCNTTSSEYEKHKLTLITLKIHVGVQTHTHTHTHTQCYNIQYKYNICHIPSIPYVISGSPQFLFLQVHHSHPTRVLLMEQSLLVPQEDTASRIPLEPVSSIWPTWWEQWMLKCKPFRKSVHVGTFPVTSIHTDQLRRKIFSKVMHYWKVSVPEKFCSLIIHNYAIFGVG